MKVRKLRYENENEKKKRGDIKKGDEKNEEEN